MCGRCGWGLRGKDEQRCPHCGRTEAEELRDLGISPVDIGTFLHYDDENGRMEDTMAITHLSQDDALRSMKAAYTADDWAELVCESHKDFHGVKARWAFGRPVAENIAWFLNHFKFDVENQTWMNSEPFPED